MKEKRKKRVLRYEVTVTCMTDFMEELCDGFFSLAIYYTNEFIQSRGWKKTQMTYRRISTGEPSAH